MKKSVLLSIKPKYCELIASGKKTVEIRKNRPKIDVPFKCYIYCTKKFDATCENYFKWRGGGKVIGEFVCDEIKSYECEFVDDDCYEEISELSTDEDGMVSGFIEWSNDCNFPYERTELFKKSCVKYNELKKYIGTKFNEFYAWHISDLVIYDKPKKLSEFLKHNRTEDECIYQHLYNKPKDCRDCMRCALQRPPQSWCYVEEMKE